jgi:uncharacterized protein (TIGR00106 family)
MGPVGLKKRKPKPGPSGRLTRWFTPGVKTGRRHAMKVIADISVVPIGVGVSLSRYVAVCEKILAEAGLETRLHAYGTNIQGEWDDVFAAIKRCHEAIHEMGAPRVSTVIKVGTRTDRPQTMDDKVRSVQSKLDK